MLKEITLLDSKKGDTKLLVSFPTDKSPWGDFEPLRGTTWSVGITEIQGASLSHALHGWMNPLLKELSRPPRVSAKRISDTEGRCKLSGSCLGWNVQVCRPGGAKPREIGPPGCYESPLPDPIFAQVAAAWKTNRHTVVVIGKEFSLT